MRLTAARRAFQLAGFSALLLGFPGVTRAQDLTCDVGDDEVRSLRFTGNHAISSTELALRVNTTPSSVARRKLHLPFGARRCLNRLYLPRDVVNVEAFYRERGYYKVKVDTVVTRVGKGAVAVTFTIVEGTPTMLGSYRVTGLDGIADSAAIMNGLRLRPGRPFDFGKFLADKDSIERRLRNSGYYRAKTYVAHNRPSDVDSATAEIEVVPGKRQRFGLPVFHVSPIDGSGQQVPNDVVRRAMGIEPGTYYSDKAITDAQRSLFQLSVYRHVEVEPLPDSLQIGDSTVTLDVRLAEDNMKGLDTEYGWGSLDCGRIRAQYSDRNFLHSARRFEVTAQASKIGYGRPLGTGSPGFCTRAAGATSPRVDGKNALESDAFSAFLHYYGGVSVRQPRLLGTKWVPTLSVYSERRGEYKAYLRTTNVGADVSATRDIRDRTQFRLGYSFEYGKTDAQPAVLCQQFSRCDDASRDTILARKPLGVVSAALSRTRTDNLVSPTRGTLMRVELRSSASKLLGSDSLLFFNKAIGDIAFYTPFGWRNVLMFRLRAGAVFGPQPFVPPQERLFAGGATSVRGFQQNELGDVVYTARDANVIKDFAGPDTTYAVASAPAAPFDRLVPLGGNSLFVANLEYRVRDPFLFPNLLQYIFFVDGGDVWNRPTTAFSMKWTPGIGMRVLTPFGPVQANFGWNRYPPQPGQMYYEDPALTQSNSPISPLYCVSPGNAIPLTLRDGVIQPPLTGGTCPATYAPGSRRSKLTITVSIGTDF